MKSDSLKSTILLVEDDPLVREVAAETLRDAGYEVKVAQDGEAAFRALPSVQPDLILSDVRMPVCSGLELLLRVRSNPTYKSTPFVILSAKAETSDQRQGMSLGADDYVTKPYLPEDLLKTIEVRLARAELFNKAIKRQQEFLSRVLPHELRTPLSGIIGYADLMTEIGTEGGSLAAAELIEYGTNLQLSGKRLLDCVEDFSLWAWFETQLDALRRGNQVALTPLTVSLAALEAALRTTVEHYARKQDVTLDVQLATLTVPAEGLISVIQHVVDNALKFSQTGTPVRITGVLRGLVYEISVCDQGRGMTEGEIEGVGMLRQFRREQHEQQGLGMGLALAGSFARLAGGELALIRNCPEPGLTVRLVLPVAIASLAR